MNIVATYDSSTNAAPAWFKTAVTCAIGQMDALITNPITLNITFSWGEENGNTIRAGAAAQNQSAGTYLNYATLYGALKSHATSATDQAAIAALGSTDPTNGGRFYTPTSMLKALGLYDANATALDGYIGLDSSLNWSPSANGQVGIGQYDPVSSLEHEISEVLGRVGYLSGSQTPGIYGPMDLFRYTAPGQRDLTPATGYFSVDGHTMQGAFNNPLLGGDAADWASSTLGDIFGNITAGLPSNFSSADLQLLDVLGYTIGSAPAQNTMQTAQNNAQSAPQQPVAAVRPQQSVSYGDALDVSANADVSGSQGANSYVFTPVPGDAVIQDFVTRGADHDTLYFSRQSFSSVPDILHHLHQVGNDAVIAFDASDKVTIENTTVASLLHNRRDFQLHAG